MRNQYRIALSVWHDHSILSLDNVDPWEMPPLLFLTGEVGNHEVRLSIGRDEGVLVDIRELKLSLAKMEDAITMEGWLRLRKQERR